MKRVSKIPEADWEALRNEWRTSIVEYEVLWVNKLHAEIKEHPTLAKKYVDDASDVLFGTSTVTFNFNPKNEMAMGKVVAALACYIRSDENFGAIACNLWQWQGDAYPHFSILCGYRRTRYSGP